MLQIDIVLGLGFGDEGKGRIVSSLCSSYADIVVRFNGGHQAGHTVIHNGVKHVFSSFGSGTLKGIPTYWGRKCTFYPTAFLNEREALKKKMNEKDIIFYADPLCPVTTPFDVKANQIEAKKNGHGSVGVGFGTTVVRHEKGYKIHLIDLGNMKILRAKLAYLKSYYPEVILDDLELEDFIVDCQEAFEYVKLREPSFLAGSRLVFEGAQGILLDQDFGFFPNVTRSNTTSKQALEMIKEIGVPITSLDINIWYVTRTYQTRHGNGFMSNEGNTIILKNPEDETNKENEFQGKFRISEIDTDLLSYALSCDDIELRGIQHQKNLAVTCNDQYPMKFDPAKIGFFDYVMKTYSPEK